MGIPTVKVSSFRLMKTAKKIKDLDGFRGEAALYEVSPPLRDYMGEKEYKFIVVSAVDSIYATETYIFGSNEEGVVTDWTELPGSQKDLLDHEIVLKEAGYTTL